jgi:hypothetical protein
VIQLAVGRDCDRPTDERYNSSLDARLILKPYNQAKQSNEQEAHHVKRNFVQKKESRIYREVM